MSKKDQNREKILNLLQVFGQLSVQQAVEALNASEATVRRLFGDMEAEHLLLRFHGGVRQLGELPAQYRFENEAVKFALEKQLIGRAAAELIVDGDRLFLDSGTTSRSFGLALLGRLQENRLRNIQVVTNSLAYTDNLARQCPILLTGGLLNPDRLDLSGAGTLSYLNHYRFSKAILGTDGINAAGDLLTSDEDTAQLVRLMAQNSEEVYILADASKLGRTDFIVSTSLLSPKFTLIINGGPPSKILQALERKKVKIRYA